MNVTVLMVDVTTCVKTPLEVSTVHVDLDTRYKMMVFPVWVSVMWCFMGYLLKAKIDLLFKL